MKHSPKLEMQYLARAIAGGALLDRFVDTTLRQIDRLLTEYPHRELTRKTA